MPAVSHKASLLREDDQPPVGLWEHRRDDLVLDRCSSVYLIMMLLGVGSLLPWNALITPIVYMRLRISGSGFESSFESMFSTTFTWSSFLSILLLQKLQNHLSLRLRILGSLFLLLAVFVLLTALAVAPLSLPEHRLLSEIRAGATLQFAVIMVCGALCGLGQGILTGSAMAYASIFAQPKYLQAVSGGQGMAGLAITLGSMMVSLPGISRVCAANTDAETLDAIVRLGVADSASMESAAAQAPVSLASGAGLAASHAHDVISAAAVYFGASSAVLVLCVVCFGVVECLPFTLARKRMQAEASAEASSSPNIAPFASQDPPAASQLPASHPPLPGSASSSNAAAPITLDSDLSHESAWLAAASRGDSTLRLLCELWKWAVAIFLTYVVTIAIFPSLTSTIIAESSVNGTGTHQAPSSCEWSHLFGPLGFVIFNLGDTVGRNLPCVLRNPTVILTVSCARVFFAPLFMLCHTAAGGALQLPNFGGNDVLALLIIAIFSVTNGWLTSSVFVASQSAIAPDRRDSAASLLVCLLQAGIAIGALLSFPVRYLDCTPSAANGFDCNPFVTPPLNVSAAF